MDALKGMRFDALPYILTLQLKRFDLDFNTMQYVKLNDDIAIPAKIAAAEFLTGPRRTPTTPTKLTTVYF
jgi:ubiquitin carboxyl-terminal hydrolase 47